jgi:hypothetical protein
VIITTDNIIRQGHYIQGVSEGIINILRGGSMDYSQ